MTTTNSGEITLSEFTGELLTRGDTGYDDARRVWNGAIDRYPAFIARCHTPGDVVAGLRLARRHGLPVAVRGGGHSIHEGHHRGPARTDRRRGARCAVAGVRRRRPGIWPRHSRWGDLR
ncbi:MAG: FAD-binding protein, partial [Pseudonocardiaceae bacterium]